MTAAAMSYWPADTSAPVLETTVGGVLRAAAAAGPDRLAMVGGLPDPGARRRWTYGQMLAEAERAARALSAPFTPGERVAVWAPNLPEWVILEYAAAMAGLVLVTVNPAYRPAELAYVLNQSGAAGIFLVPEFRSPMAAFLDEVRPVVPSLREVFFFTDWGEVIAAFVRPAPGAPRPTPDELRAHCRQRLAPYKTPVHWVFVDAFPMTPSGKIQKYKLQETFAEHQPA